MNINLANYYILEANKDLLKAWRFTVSMLVIFLAELGIPCLAFCFGNIFSDCFGKKEVEVN
jgi:hypothetical protein